MVRFLRTALVCSALALFTISTLPQQGVSAADTSVSGKPAFPGTEALSYSIEWRLITAGEARWTLSESNAAKSAWESKLHLESGGIVSKLYKLDDNYHVALEDGFCATASDLDAAEGKRHRETKVTFDRGQHKASYSERDLLKNSVIKSAETEIPACVSDVVGALYKLRTLHLEPGQSAQIPVSDGKKSVSVRVEAQDRESVKTKSGAFKTIRYEAFIFNGVLYSKKANLLIWLTEDARKVPVQIRARMPFPIGSITLELDKDEHS